MEYHFEQTDTRTLMRGSAATLHGALERQDRDLGHLVLGVLLALHSAGQHGATLTLDGPSTLEERPLEILLDHATDKVYLRFLDSEEA